jgi:hypothetical protein
VPDDRRPQDPTPPPPGPGGPQWSPQPVAADAPPAWSRPSPRPDAGGSEPNWSPPPEPRRPIGLGLVLIAAGVLWLLHLAGVDLRWEVLLPIGLVVVGVLVLVSRRWGGGLVGLGIVLAILALVLAVPGPATFTAGDRTVAVTDVADLDSRYGLGAGTMTLDLRDLELPPGTTTVRAGVNLGELVVLVPPEATIAGDGRATMGEVSRFGRATGGIAPRGDLTEPGTDPDRILELQLRVGLGQIEVRR